MNESLSLNDYQAAAEAVRLPSATALYAVLGLPGEAGEVSSLFAKAERDGAGYDFQQNVKKELGDCLWFIAMIALDNGFTLEEVAQANIDKLNSRKERGVLQGSGNER